MPYAVVVTFEIKPDRIDEFMPLMLSNARTSRAVENGCHQFDTATDVARPSEVFLYELYEDSAAFDTHLASVHFRAFDTAVADMIAAKTVRTYTQVIQ